jgi:hypothetical protein
MNFNHKETSDKYSNRIITSARDRCCIFEQYTDFLSDAAHRWHLFSPFIFGIKYTVVERRQSKTGIWTLICTMKIVL